MTDSLDDIKLDWDAPTGNPTFDQVNPWEGFLRSAASSATLEMFGHKPSEVVEGYRSEHPYMGLLSELTGVAGGYGAAFKGLEHLPQYNAMLDGAGALAGDAEGKTIASGMARGAASMGTVEAGRIAGAAVTGGDVKQTAEEGLFDTAAATGLGGIGGAFRAAGRTDASLDKLGIDIDMKEPAQVHMKAMKDAIDSGKVTPDDLPAAKAIIGDMKDAVLGEELPKENKYVSDLDTGDAQPINRLFKTSALPEGKESDVVRKRYIVSGRDFPDTISSTEALSAAGLSDDLDAVQFPRSIAFNSKNGAKSVESEITKNLTQVGDNEFLGKEPNGLYVMAKKVVGNTGEADASDRWALFKTHDPARFSENADFASKVEDRNAWLAEKPIPIDPEHPKDILDEAQNMYNTMPMKGYYQATSGKSMAAAVDGIASRLGVEGESELGKRTKALLRETFAPAMNEYKNNPRAQYIYAHARNAFQKADSITHAMTYGDETLAEGKSVWGKLTKGSEATGKFKGLDAFNKIISGLSKDEFADVNKAWNMQLAPEKLGEAVSERIISPGAADALKKIDALDEYLIEQTKATQGATGDATFTPIKGHYLLPRTWEGSWRVPIFSEDNKLVYMASGKTKVGSEKMAKDLLDNKEVAGWYSKEPFLADTDRDFELAQQVRVGSPEYLTAAQLRANLAAQPGTPASFKVRTGVGGYKTDFTKEELVNKFRDNVSARNRYLAESSVRKILGPELTKLGIQNKGTFDSVQRRINALAGRQGEVSRAINEYTDKIFAPALGKNSASTIARTINRTMGHLTIGAGNIQRPVIDMMTFMQTVLPRIAFTMKASDSSLANAYSWLPVIDRTGMVKGSMGTLSPFRIMKQSFQLMSNPTAELSDHLNKALHESTIDEWIGHNSQQRLSLKKVLDGEEGYGKFLEKLSSFLPTTAWKLSRANAFVVGHILGKGLSLEGDGLFRFAKEFTDKTMYSYMTADKPRVFTGPLGGVFGQFKNWTAHYIGNMLEYAGEGYNYNNWSPLMYQMGGTTALGGLSATALMPIGNTFSQWLTDKSLMENLYERMGGGSGDNTLGGMSDALYMGLPAFLGLSLSGGVADPLSDPSRDAGMMFSFVQMNRAMALGKALGMAWDNYKMTGQHPVDSEATRDLLIQAMAPKVIARLAQQTHDDGIKSLNNGGMIMKDMNLAEKMMYDAGFMPKRIELAHEVSEQLWKDQDAMRDKIQTMGRLWHDAEENDASDVLTDLNKTAMVSGIPIDRVIASARGLDRIAQTPQLDRKFKPADLMRFKSLNIIGDN